MDFDEVDFEKPLLFQVGHLGDSYNKWVHQPRLSLSIPCFFENNVLEYLTRTPWWLLPIIWLPVAVYMQILSLQKGLPLHKVPLTMALGMFLWTLVEYLIHRHIFHMKSSDYWSNTFHYFIHGYHHKHPMDNLRLVFPPVLSLISMIPQYFALKLIFPYHVYQSIFGGGQLGYLAYDLTHYYLHQGNPRNKLLKKLKKIHLIHHYKNYDGNFGVTYPLWDFVFGTYDHKKVKKSL